MILSNNEIYTHATNLLSEFGADCNVKLPIKINFFLQKNIKLLIELAQDIDEARLNIAKEYGELNENGDSYSVPPESIAMASTQLKELFNLIQDVKIHTFKIDDFNDIELTYKQMNALMFMIEE